MKEERQERLFRAIGDVGADLIDMAEKQTFAPSRWRKWGSLAACLAVILCLGVLAMPYFPKGCGSGSKGTAAPGASVTTEAPAAAEPAEEEAVETPQEETGPAEDAAPEPVVRTRFVFRYTYYYLTDQEPRPLDNPPSVLGELLGEVEACDDPSLVGCPVYRYLNTTEYDNHSVNGLTVPAEVWVETEEGYRFAVTLNEKTVSRYTVDDVLEHLEEDDGDWIVSTFVGALWEMDDFSDPSELNSEQLNMLLTLTRGMNTGIDTTALWFRDEGVYVVPLEEARWRVSRFLDADRCTYTPEETAAYDGDRDALVFESLPLTALETQVLLLDEAALVDDTLLYLRVSAYHQPETPLTDEAAPLLSTREFLIRFDEDSWRYQSIVTLN